MQQSLLPCAAVLRVQLISHKKQDAGTNCSVVKAKLAATVKETSRSRKSHPVLHHVCTLVYLCVKDPVPGWTLGKTVPKLCMPYFYFILLVRQLQNYMKSYRLSLAPFASCCFLIYLQILKMFSCILPISRSCVLIDSLTLTAGIKNILRAQYYAIRRDV